MSPQVFLFAVDSQAIEVYFFAITVQPSEAHVPGRLV